MLYGPDSSTEIAVSVKGGQARPVSRRIKDLGPAIGRRMKQARKIRSMSQLALSELAHTSPTTIVTIEKGEGGNSGIGLLCDIAKALKVPAEWLLLGIGEGPTPEK